MSEENEISSPSRLKSDKDEQNYFHSEVKENNCNKANNKHHHDRCSSDIDSSEKVKKVDNNTEAKDEERLEEIEKVVKNHSPIKNVEKADLLQRIDDLDDQDIREKFSNLSEHELLEVSKELESANFYLSKENEVYEFILNDDEMLQSFLGKVEEVDKDISVPETFELTYPDKCYFAKKKLEHAEKALKLKNDDHALELQNLNFELQSLNKSLKDLNEAKEKFDKNIRIDGRHPVTKKVILQKVAKYFDDSIRIQVNLIWLAQFGDHQTMDALRLNPSKTKMDLANRYKMQIQDDIREQNKIINQIKAQEKRLAFLDMTEFQEAQFEYKKSCRELAMCKEQLGKYKAKQSFLIQKIAKLKEDLKEEESGLEQRKNAVKKIQHLKEVTLSEITRDDEKVSELKAEMRKIKLDPRRHNLPEVIDYAAVQRENRIVMKNVDKWRKKVEALQQEKLLHLNVMIKKKKY